MTADRVALARARSLVAIERWQEAIEALAPAMASEATAIDAHCIAAQCYLGLDKPKRAKGEAEQALALAPEHPWAHRLLAIACLNSGSIREARLHAAEAVRLVPDSIHAQHVLVLAHLADRQAVAAGRVATAALEANPHEPLAHLSQALVKEQQKDWAGAEVAYREGLRIDPDDPTLTLGLARTLHRMGKDRRAEAGDAYLAAARANPTGGEARRGLARLGVPLVGFGLVVKLLIFSGAQASLRIDNPLAVAGLAAAALLVVGGGMTLLRINGTRHLPDPVRSGLMADHRDFALGWLAAAGLVAVLLGIWAALAPRSHGGGPLAAAGLIAFGLVALFFGRRSPAVSATPRRWARAYGRRFRRIFRLS